MISNSTLCYLFIGNLKKYTVSGVTFSFKVKALSIVKALHLVGKGKTVQSPGKEKNWNSWQK